MNANEYPRFGIQGSRFTVALAALAALAAAMVASTACDPVALEDVPDDTRSSRAPLVLSTFSEANASLDGIIWQTDVIPVCLEPYDADRPATVSGQALDDVFNAGMAATQAYWGGHSRLTFVWSDSQGDPLMCNTPDSGCSGSNTPGIHVRFLYDGYGSGFANAGQTYNDGCADGVNLRVYDDGQLVSGSIIDILFNHEFGHALGFGHDTDRDDADACDRTAYAHYENLSAGGLEIGDFDDDSVMNAGYCNDMDWSLDEPSVADLQGVQYFYGKPESGIVYTPPAHRVGPANNVALGRPVLVAGGANGAAATNGVWVEAPVSSGIRTDPWLEIDLGRTRVIEKLTIWEDPQSGLGAYTLRLLASDRSTVASHARAAGLDDTHSHVFPDPGGNRARYVRLELTGSADLRVREIQVFAPRTRYDNVAKGATATQSPDSGASTVAARAVDGDTDGKSTHGSVARTGQSAGQKSSWEVDLGSAYPISIVGVWGRTDGSPLSDYTVKLLDPQRAVVSAHAVAETKRYSEIVLSQPQRARFVRVERDDPGLPLELAEVEVWSSRSEIHRFDLDHVWTGRVEDAITGDMAALNTTPERIAGADGERMGALSMSQSFFHVDSPEPPSGDITLSAWVRDASGTIASKGHGGDGAITDYIFSIYNGVPMFFGNDDWHLATRALDPGWNHVAVTYDGSSVRFYIGGQPAGQISSPGELYASTSPVFVGIQGEACQCNAFVGGLDDVRIFDRALSDQDIADIATPVTAAYYPLDLFAAPTPAYCAGDPGNPAQPLAAMPESATAPSSAACLVSDGISGNALRFSSTPTQIADGAPPATDPRALTLSAWVRNVASGNHAIVSKGDGGDGAITDYIFSVISGQLWFFGNGQWHSANQSLGPGWNHVAVTYDGEDVRFYINGVIEGRVSSPGALYAGSSPVLLGVQGNGCQCNAFAGDMDEVQIFAEVLDAGAIAALYAQPMAQYAVPVYQETPANAPHVQYHLSARSQQQAAVNGWRQLHAEFAADLSATPGTVPVYVETPAGAPNSQYYFSMRSAQEAAQSGWTQLGVAFHAFATPQPGTIPVYAETPTDAPHSRYHFSTRSAQAATQVGWTQLGVAFYAYPAPL